MLSNARQSRFHGRTQFRGGALLALLAAVLVLIGTAYPSAAAATAARAGSRAEETEAGMTVVYLPMIAQGGAENLWHGEYYANTTLTGTPVFTTDNEVRIDYDWNRKPPDDRLPKNGFSIRWTGNWYFEAGQHTFFVYSDDGVRLWVDDQLLLDSWGAGVFNLSAAKMMTPAGAHTVKLEYYDDTGNAQVRLHWRRTDLYPQWDGAYYSSAFPSANYWKFDQLDPTIEFGWDANCPPGLPSCDNFSIVWSASPVLEVGNYRAFIFADDGFQFYRDGSLLKENGWATPQWPFEFTVDFSITTAGTHSLQYNYHEFTGYAETRVWIENLSYPWWTAEYYTNNNLQGAPYYTRAEAAPFYNWFDGAPSLPAPYTMPKDNFSIRWSGQRYFHTGFYRFGAHCDDGVRLYVDGEKLIDSWIVGPGPRFAPATYLKAGYHDVVLEYFDATGLAQMRFWWQ